MSRHSRGFTVKFKINSEMAMAVAAMITAVAAVVVAVIQTALGTAPSPLIAVSLTVGAIFAAVVNLAALKRPLPPRLSQVDTLPWGYAPYP